MCRADRVAEGALALASPHDSVNGITADVVFCQRLPESLYFGVMETKRTCLLAGERHLLQRRNPFEVASKDIFIPAENLHAPRLCLRQNACEHVETGMVRSRNLFQGSTLVVVLVRVGKIAAVKFGIVFLLAMIRQRLAGNLPAGNAAAVSESGDKECVDPGLALKAVQNGLNAFVHKGYGAHLNANGAASGLRRLNKARGKTRSTD